MAACESVNLLLVQSLLFTEPGAHLSLVLDEAVYFEPVGASAISRTCNQIEGLDGENWEGLLELFDTESLDDQGRLIELPRGGEPTRR